MQKHRRLIFLIVYLAYTSIYIARINLSMAKPDLEVLGILDTAQLGLLGGLFSTVFAVGRLANGSLSDRTPPYVMLTTGLVLAGASNVLVGLFPPFIGMLLLWGANAFAQSMLWSSVLCVVARLYDVRTAKKKTSLMVTSVATGNILAILLGSLIITYVGVRFAFIIPGILTIVLGALTLLATRHIKPLAADKKEDGGEHISLFRLLSSRDVLTMSIPAFLHGVMKDNIPLFMAAFIFDRYALSIDESFYFLLLIPSIGLVGRLLYPLAYKLCGEKENTVSMLGFILCIIASIPLVLGGISAVCDVVLLGVIYTAASMINTSMLSIYPLRYAETGNVASVSGIMDLATYMGAGVTGMIFGFVIASFGYAPMFACFAVISCISILVLLLVDRSRRKSA